MGKKRIIRNQRKRGRTFLQVNTPDDEGIFLKIYNNYN